LSYFSEIVGNEYGKVVKKPWKIRKKPGKAFEEKNICHFIIEYFFEDFSKNAFYKKYRMWLAVRRKIIVWLKHSCND